MRRRVHSSSWLIFIMVCLVATASSQSVPPVSFRVAPTYAAGSAPFEPVSVAVGGFNGDGKPDLGVGGGGGGAGRGAWGCPFQTTKKQRGRSGRRRGGVGVFCGPAGTRLGA